MNKNYKKFCFCIFALVLSLALFSCKKNSNNSSKWNPETGHVAILFGYGYNDSDFVSQALQNLSEKYGLAEDGGLIVHFVYPDDFSAGGAARISNLSYYVEENNCKALITLGAPEYTHRSLAKIQDDEAKCFIISLFSQDDVLSTEADSNVVIDFIESDDELELEVSSGEATIQHLEKTVVILEQTIKAVSGKNLFDEKPASEVIASLYGSEWQVGSYVDSTTGLKSRNHFVLKYVGKPVIEKKKRGIFAR